MVCGQGMSGTRLYLSAGGHDWTEVLRFHPDARPAVEALVDEAFETAVQVISKRRSDLERLADALVEKGELSGRESAQILEGEAPSSLTPTEPLSESEPTHYM